MELVLINHQNVVRQDLNDEWKNLQYLLICSLFCHTIFQRNCRVTGNDKDWSSGLFVLQPQCTASFIFWIFADWNLTQKDETNQHFSCRIDPFSTKLAVVHWHSFTKEAWDEFIAIPLQPIVFQLIYLLCDVISIFSFCPVCVLHIIAIDPFWYCCGHGLLGREEEVGAAAWLKARGREKFET